MVNRQYRLLWGQGVYWKYCENKDIVVRAPLLMVVYWLILPPSPTQTPWRKSPSGLVIEDTWLHSDTQHSAGISQMQRALHDNTQRSQHTRYVPGGIRTLNPSKRAAADPGRPFNTWVIINKYETVSVWFKVPARTAQKTLYFGYKNRSVNAV